MTRLMRNKISPLLWTLVWRPRSIWRKQGSRSWMTNWDKRLSPPPTSDIRNCFRISEVCIERIGIRRWTERDRKICPFFFLRNWTNIVTDDEIRNAILTAMITGANTTQQIYQKLFNRIPIIWCMQSQNFFAPNIQDIAIVWKKQTQRIDIPLAE